MNPGQEQILKKQFVELTFNNAWKRKLDDRSFKDDELIEYCLDKAWVDAIIYVRKKNSPNDTIILDNSDNIKQRLRTAILTGAWNDDFDTWHNDMCENTDFGMRYGVWQKFINMSFKYIYCINDTLTTPIDPEILKQCHIPLDDNTLLWCRNKRFTEITSWNSISKDEYIIIRDRVKEFVDNNQDLDSALQLDFWVWRIKKICDVLRNIKNLRDDLQGLDDLHSWFDDCGFDINNRQDVSSVLEQINVLKEYFCGIFFEFFYSNTK